jgi:hypothetical protein
MGVGSVAIALQLCTFNPSMSAAVGPAEARDSGVFLGALLPVPKGSRRMGGSRPLSMECPEDSFSVLQEQGLPPAFFPGPVWLVVPRNGKEPPYAYGYL